MADATEHWWLGERRLSIVTVATGMGEVMTDSVLEARGHNGTVTFDGNFVAIVRTGALARMTVGKGEKRIPVGSVTAVQWKPPGALVNGFIQFTVAGGNEMRSRMGSQTRDAVHDENSVIVTKAHAEDFEKLRAAVEAAIVARHQPPPLVHNAAPAQPSRLDQLKQLGELRDAGVLTAEEFEREKCSIMDADGAGHAASPTSSLPPPPQAPVPPPPGAADAERIDPADPDSSDRPSGGAKAARIAGALATGGLSEVGRFALKKKRS